MMEDKWKEFFTENQSEFRSFELPKGHENRFLEKLKLNTKPKSKPTYNYWKIAAVLIPLLMIAVYYFAELKPKSVHQEVNLSEYSQGLSEANDYFAYVIQEKLKEVKSLQTNENKALINHSINELDSLQANYNQLLQDLKESGGNPQVIKSVVMNLQLQVEVLESVMNQINTNQTIKSNSYENTY